MCVCVCVCLFPSYNQAVFLYWITNASMTTLITFFLNLPQTRKLVGLPPQPPSRLPEAMGGVAGVSGLGVTPPPPKPPKSSPNFARFREDSSSPHTSSQPIIPDPTRRQRRNLRRRKRFFSSMINSGETPSAGAAGLEQLSQTHLRVFRGGAGVGAGTRMSTLL